jgi:hypothetical protein
MAADYTKAEEAIEDWACIFLGIDWRTASPMLRKAAQVAVERAVAKLADEAFAHATNDREVEDGLVSWLAREGYGN